MGTESTDSSAAAFGVAILAAAIAPTLSVEIVALLVVGATSISFLATASTTLQLSSEPQMRGRVMALWSVAFLGIRPVASIVDGAVAAAFGVRVAGVVMAIPALVGAVLAANVIRSGAPFADRRAVRER